MRGFGTLGPFAGPTAFMNGWADGRICGRFRAQRRELDKGVRYEHEKDSGRFGCGPGDFFRGGGCAAVSAGTARESVDLQRDDGGEDRDRGELPASQRIDDDWFSGDAAAADGEGRREGGQQAGIDRGEREFQEYGVSAEIRERVFDLRAVGDHAGGQAE